MTMDLLHLRVPRQLINCLDDVAEALTVSRHGIPVTRSEVARLAFAKYLTEHIGEASNRATRCTDNPATKAKT